MSYARTALDMFSGGGRGGGRGFVSRFFSAAGDGFGYCGRRAAHGAAPRAAQQVGLGLVKLRLVRLGLVNLRLVNLRLGKLGLILRLVKLRLVKLGLGKLRLVLQLVNLRLVRLGLVLQLVNLRLVKLRLIGLGLVRLQLGLGVGRLATLECWRLLGPGGRRYNRFGCLLFSRLLQFAERTVTPFVNAVEAGFVAGGEREGAGVVGEPAEGSRKLIAGVGGFGLGVVWKVLAVHFTIEERGFDDTHA
jgi:hypothetical protein